MDRFLLMHSFARMREAGSFFAVAWELGTGNRTTECEPVHRRA
jgi:hypothetical protein